MSLLSDFDLQSFNTFGVAAKAQHCLEITSEDDLTEHLEGLQQPIRILGGGSNILITQDLEGTLILNNILGIEVVDEEDDHATIRVGAGMIWHDFVLWTLKEGYFGFENLSLIPGKVGAAPIQNIGAYGVEQETCFVGLECIDLTTGRHHVFNHEECAFGYRDSYFKNEGKGRYCITAVYYRLSRIPQLQLTYGAISKALSDKCISNPSPRDVSDVIIAIRQSKLPDPKVIGNGGSFFKNPIITKADLDRIQKDNADLPHYPQDDGLVKLSAGWLIDQCGWKGRRIGETGTYKNHALVLVNHGGASGVEIWSVAEQIIQDVHARFGVVLEPEVNRW